VSPQPLTSILRPRFDDFRPGGGRTTHFWVTVCGFVGWVCALRALCADLGDHGDRVYVSRGVWRAPTWPLDLRTGSEKGWGESAVPQNSSELRVKQHRPPPASPGPRITPSVRERCCLGPTPGLSAESRGPEARCAIAVLRASSIAGKCEVSPQGSEAQTSCRSTPSEQLSRREGREAGRVTGLRASRSPPYGLMPLFHLLILIYSTMSWPRT
jgi:hypothetical protein